MIFVKNKNAMRKAIILFTYTLFILAICGRLPGQELESRLDELSARYAFTWEPLRVDTFFTEKYLLRLEQPVNHGSDTTGSFTQRIFVSHLGSDHPVVFITEGYSTGYAAYPKYIHELSTILEANQICVEHRYFGESAPDPLRWEYLTVENAARDHHRVVELFKEIYGGKWVSTGISKGGQTMMYHRCFFPEDVDASVGYVCPLNFSVEDRRMYDFLSEVGSEECRRKIKDFQTDMLENRSKYLPAFEKMAENRGLQYSIGNEKAYDLTVLEYSFAFWQWGQTSCDSIPEPGSDPAGAVNHLDRVAGIDWVSDEGISGYRPFFYQALTEIGFYGYDISGFEGLTVFDSNPTFIFTAPEGMFPVYNSGTMRKVDRFIRHEADNMIFIYGEYDPWSATAVDLTGNTNSVKFIKPGGSHLTRIFNLPWDMRQELLSTLMGWLNMEE